MFEGLNKDSIEEALVVDANAEVNQRDVHLALTTLLLEMAGADQSSVLLESSCAAQMLESDCGLNKAQVGELFAIANQLVGNKAVINRFTSLIADNFSVEQRQKVVSMLWKIMVADGKVDDNEAKLAASIADKLKLSIEEVEKALH